LNAGDPRDGFTTIRKVSQIFKNSNEGSVENEESVPALDSMTTARQGGKSMEDTNATVAVFETHAEADEAVKELQKAGFDMKKLSVVGKDYHTEEQVVGYYNAGDRMKHWGKLGAFWGGLWGLLFGAAFFWVPGIGPVLVGGPLVAWIIAGLEGAVLVGGVSAIGAGLVSLGIPKNSIVEYETALKAGKFVVVAHGTAEDVAKARNILSTLKPSGLNDHVLEPAGAAAS
jgi:uncharacterized membrane protein